MSPTPRRTLESDFIAELPCPICGQEALSLRKMERYPDYVACSNCESQFVAEDGGERVMFGKIPATYPRTRRFALQQWAWPEAIARRAAEERPALASKPTAPPPSEPSPAVDDSAGLVPEAEASDSWEPHESATETEMPPSQVGSIEEMAPTAVPLEADEEPAATAEWELEDEPTSLSGTADEALEDEPTTTELPSEWELESEPATEIQPEAEFESGPGPADTMESDSKESGDGEDLRSGPDMAAAADEDSQQDQTMAAEEDLFSDLGWEESEVPDRAPVEADTELGPMSTSVPEDEAADGEPMGDEFSFLRQQIESEDLGAQVDDAEDAGGVDWDDEAATVFMPPFGSSSEGLDEPDLPGEAEPAPPIPDWLNQPAADDELESRAPSSGMNADTSAPSMEAEGEAGEAENLLDSLWDQADEEAADMDTQAMAVSDEPEFEPAWGTGGSTAGGQDIVETREGLDFADDPFADLEELGAPAAMDIGGEELPSEEGHDLAMEDIARQYWAGDRAQPTEDLPVTAPALEEGQTEMDAEGAAASRAAEEPPPGHRYRVVLRRNQPVFPEDMCAHCTQSPTIAKLPITATVFQGSGLGERSLHTFRIPICSDCQARQSSQSEEQQTAKLMAHLVSVLVAMVLVVSSLAFRIVDFQGNLLLDLVILFILAGMGYFIPAVFLLIRASRFPQSEDAKYIQSTMKVPSDTEGTEVAFEWRNPTYAQHFLEANAELAASKVLKVRERAYDPS